MNKNPFIINNKKMPSRAVPTNQALYNRVKNETIKKFRVYPSIYANAWLIREYKKRGGRYTTTRRKVSRRKSKRKVSMRKNTQKKVQRKKSKKISRKKSGLSRWFAEKWVDACQLPRKVSCGRKKSSLKRYPYCRPSIRVNRSTPKTIHEIPKSVLKSRCRRKRSNPMKIIR